MARAHINPAILRWAAGRAGVETLDLSKTFRKPPEAIQGWFEGSSAPTFKQAQRLAKRLRVPFGYLFLSNPPDEDLPIRDFRRVHGKGLREPSVDLRDVVSDVLVKQDWYWDFRADHGEPPVAYVGRFSIRSPISEVAEDIRSALDFASTVRPQDRSRFLETFVRQVEGLGILVMRNGIVRQATNRALKVDEFRGLSIADPMAPVVFINNADSNAAQVFTLAHELAHIWIGEGGVSDAEVTVMRRDGDDVEAFCNEVAGELLLPWSQLRQPWSTRSVSKPRWLQAMSKRFHVSTVMVARQLWTHAAIDSEEFFEIYEVERENWTPSESTASGGDYYRMVPIRNSRLLTEAILESVAAAETSIRDASRLLGVKPAKLPKLRQSGHRVLRDRRTKGKLTPLSAGYTR